MSMSDVWHLVNTLVAILALGVAWRAGRHTESKEEAELKLKVGILEERLSNELRLLEKLESKLDDIERLL